tara:strand:- start:267 stop:452 length:186 start_codon:yes stop_codon:yes gene_type:complete
VLPINQLWYLLPLVISISLVYGATRHEFMAPILYQSYKSAVWILGFVGVISVILFLISLML